ncbi:hypothetical protein PSYRMG_13185 [Pseudomonas syringae UMAF0158]|nr:hypothetical protein PSYRMG_13185 [Pseudomonas syringae UMAF0158]
MFAKTVVQTINPLELSTPFTNKRGVARLAPAAFGQHQEQ